MNHTLFLTTRHHYPYECTEEDLKLLGIPVHSMTIHESLDDTGEFELHIRPCKPVEFIYMHDILNSLNTGHEHTPDPERLQTVMVTTQEQRDKT